jgi:hypothetical protein
VLLDAVRPEDIDSGSDANADVGNVDDADGDDGVQDNLALRFGGFALRLRAGHCHLEVGSDVEISQRTARELAAELGPVVFAEGEVWFYSARIGCWIAIPHDLLRRLIHAFDGAFSTGRTARPRSCNCRRTGATRSCAKWRQSSPSRISSRTRPPGSMSQTA